LAAGGATLTTGPMQVNPMAQPAALFFLLAFITVIAMVLKTLLKRSTPRATAWPVRAHSPLSDPEQVLYWRLCEAFPEHVVLSQVALSQLIQVDRVKERQAVFNRISQLVADFVVCTKAFAVIAVVELDDLSHETGARATANARTTQALAAAGYRLVRLHVSRMPSVAELQARVPPPAVVSMTVGTGPAKQLKARGAFG
jgi:very-short-patch-repair endonuclease